MAERFGLFPESLEQSDLLELGHIIDLLLGGAVDDRVRVLEEPLKQVAKLLPLLHVEHILIAQVLQHFSVFCGHGGSPFVI